MYRKISVITMLLIFSLSLLSNDQRSQNSPQTPGQFGQAFAEEKLEEVKVAQFADVFLYMPLYLADGKGFFKEQGLSVTLISTGGDDKTFAAVISGDAHFGIADPTFVAIARSKGQPGKVIASVVNGVPFWGVTKNSDVPKIKEPKQLEGFTVATFPSPSTAFTLQKQMFEGAGLKPQIRQAAFGALLPLLETGAVDIALELEPNVSTAVKQGARVVYSMAEMYGDFAITGVTTREALIAENPDLVQKFVNAIQQAESYAHANPDATAAFALKRFPNLDPVIVAEALKRIIESKTLPKNTLISEAAWEKACQLRVDAGDLPAIDAAAVDNTFAEKAVETYK